MKNLIFLGAILLASQICIAQDITAFSRKWQYSITAGAGYSYYHYTSNAIHEKFAAPEFRAGINFRKPLSEKISINSGLRLGIRLRTARVYQPNEYMNGLQRSLGSLDETSSKEDHYFFEIPLNVQYKYRNFRFGAGVVYRNLVQFDDTKYVNYMSTSDVGITPSVTYRLTTKLGIGAEYYIGTIRFFEGWSRDSGNDIYIKARNRFAQLFITYSL